MLIDLILPSLERLQARLLKAEITRPNLLPDFLITTLRNIKRHESLKAHYQALYNQWLVLLVSYFGSAVGDLFVDSASQAIREQRGGAILKESIKAPIAELAEEHEDIGAFLADLLASTEAISFQDMQSIGRAFGQILQDRHSKGRDSQQHRRRPSLPSRDSSRWRGRRQENASTASRCPSEDAKAESQIGRGSIFYA